MEINNQFPIQAAHGLQGPHRSRAAAGAESALPAAGPSLQAVDELDLSPAALASVDSGSSDIRTDRVAQLRHEIAQGNYDSPERLSAALDRFLDQLG
jgi:negative regulator of flagellin synthesis FlgM